MTVLYIDRRSMRIEREGRALVLRDGDERLTSVPMRLLERVIIQGGARMDVAILRQLSALGVPVAILGRHSDQAALVQNGMGPDARRRLLQYRMLDHPAWRRRWSTRLVRHKLTAQLRLLHHARLRRADLRHPITRAIERVRCGLETIEKEGEPPLARLRGVEGAGCRLDKAGRTLFYQAWEQQARPLRRNLRRLMPRIVQALEAEEIRP